MWLTKKGEKQSNQKSLKPSYVLRCRIHNIEFTSTTIQYTFYDRVVPYAFDADDYFRAENMLWVGRGCIILNYLCVPLKIATDGDDKEKKKTKSVINKRS